MTNPFDVAHPDQLDQSIPREMAGAGNDGDPVETDS